MVPFKPLTARASMQEPLTCRSLSERREASCIVEEASDRAISVTPQPATFTPPLATAEGAHRDGRGPDRVTLHDLCIEPRLLLSRMLASPFMYLL